MNAWDRVGEVGKKIESFTKVIQGPKEVFAGFLQRLTSAVKRMIPNSEAKQIIIESLAFESVNSLCERVISLSKARSAPMEDWIRDTTNIESHEHDDAWIGEVIQRSEE